MILIGSQILNSYLSTSMYKKCRPVNTYTYKIELGVLTDAYV